MIKIQNVGTGSIYPVKSILSKDHPFNQEVKSK
jgi:hypothetical protein